jgi:hypothetical protein
MPRLFSFEREVHATLDLMPFTVRRKLDLAGLKLSLAGWQTLPIADRRALTDAEVDDDASVASFAAALRAAAARVDAPLAPLPSRGLPPWRETTVPIVVAARLLELGAPIADAAWAALDDEARYALLNLSEKRRERGAPIGTGAAEAGAPGPAPHPERLRAALVELGLARG